MSYFTFEDKKIYYSECGTYSPLLFLHENTASSNSMITNQNEFYKISRDFLLR